MKVGGGYAPEQLPPKAAKHCSGCTGSTQRPARAKSCLFSSDDHDVGQCRRPAAKVQRTSQSARNARISRSYPEQAYLRHRMARVRGVESKPVASLVYRTHDHSGDRALLLSLPAAHPPAVGFFRKRVYVLVVVPSIAGCCF